MRAVRTRFSAGGVAAVALALGASVGCGRSVVGVSESACEAPLSSCGDSCVDARYDPTNCGACGNTCGSAKFCDRGACIPRDAAGTGGGVSLGGGTGGTSAAGRSQAGGGTAGRTSTGGTSGGANHQGGKSGQGGSAGGGTVACSSPELSCDDGCVDPRVDHDNCGACGMACGDEAACNDGACDNGTSIWPTLGGDVRHSGFAVNERGTPPLSLAWKTQLAQASLWPAVSDGSSVYVSNTSYFQQHSLWALSVADGSLIWSYDFGNVFGIGQAAVVSGRVYTAQCNNNPGTYMYAFDAASGKVIWTQPFTAQWENYWAPIVVGSRLYFDGGEYGGLYALNRMTGASVFFNSKVGQYDEWSPLALGDRVYTFVDGNLVAHDPDTGDDIEKVKTMWNWEGYEMLTSPISDGKSVFVISPPNLFAFTPDLATQTWTANGGYAGMPAVANGVVYSLSAGHLRANDAESGEVLWTFTGDSKLEYPPVVVGNTIFASSADTVYAVDASTHDSVWSAEPGGWLSVAAGDVFVAQVDGTLAAYALTRP